MRSAADALAALHPGALGWPAATPASTRLGRMVSPLPIPPRSDWEVIGIGQDQWRLVAAAIGLGGNVRVGLEDNFYVSPGVMAESNGKLVEKAARMIRDQGREVASVAECRERLKLVHT